MGYIILNFKEKRPLIQQITNMIKPIFLFLSLFIAITTSAQLTNELDSILKAKVDNSYNANDSFGVSVSVTHQDGYSWKYAVGNSHKNTALTTDMLMGIGSNTKLFTSVLCFKFQENGLLDLDDPLYTWLSLSAFPNIDSTATLRQCLQHNTGFADYVDVIMPDSVIDYDTVNYSYNEILSLVQSPNFAIGANIAYSSTNFVLAEMILNQISGREYYQLVRDSILEPLNLNHTYCEGFEPINEPIAHPWYNNTDMDTVSRIALSTASRGAGCIVSTPGDMTKWYAAIFRHNFISNQSINEMSNFIDWNGTPYDMGLGIYKVMYMQQELWGHSGQTIGYNSYTIYSPKGHYQISVIINDTHKSPRNLILQLSKKMSDYNKWLDIEEIEKAGNKIRVFPNSSKDNIRITSESTINKVEIFDINGKLVLNYDSINKREMLIDISSFTEGIYSVIIYTNNSKFVKKVVKL